MNKKDIEKIVKENNGEEVLISESHKFFFRVQLNPDKTFSRNFDSLSISFLSDGEINSLDNTHIYVFKNNDFEAIVNEGKSSTMNEFLHHTYIVQFDENGEKVNEIFAFASCSSDEKTRITKNIVEKLFNKKIASY